MISLYRFLLIAFHGSLAAGLVLVMLVNAVLAGLIGLAVSLCLYMIEMVYLSTGKLVQSVRVKAQSILTRLLAKLAYSTPLVTPETREELLLRKTSFQQYESERTAQRLAYLERRLATHKQLNYQPLIESASGSIRTQQDIQALRQVSERLASSPEQI